MQAYMVDAANRRGVARKNKNLCYWRWLKRGKAQSNSKKIRTSSNRRTLNKDSMDCKSIPSIEKKLFPCANSYNYKWHCSRRNRSSFIPGLPYFFLILIASWICFISILIPEISLSFGSLVLINFKYFSVSVDNSSKREVKSRLRYLLMSGDWELK